MNKIFDPLYFLFEEKINGFESFLANYAGLEAFNNTGGKSVIFNIYFKHDIMDYDEKWAKTLRHYVYNFTTRTVGMTNYTEFFGSPYLGLQKIVFTTGDKNQWFTEIFDADADTIYQELIPSS